MGSVSRGLCSVLVVALVAGSCAGVDGPTSDRTWLRGLLLGATPGNAFVLAPASTPYWEIRSQGDALEVVNTSMGSGITPVVYAGNAPARLAWEIRADLLQEGIDGGWGVEFGYQEGEAYRALIYASGRFCVDRAFGEYPEFIHCVTRLPAIRIGEVENVMGLEVDGPRVRVRVNGHVALDFEDERLRPGALALAVAGAGVKVVFRSMELRDLSQ